MNNVASIHWGMFLEDAALPSGLADRWDFAYRSMISFFEPYIKSGARVLDVGCGEGVLSLYLGYLGCQVLAVDHSPYQIARNEVLARKMGLSCVYFKVYDIEEKKFGEGEPFDTIVCTDILEHFDDPESIFSWIVGHLKENGTIFLSLPSPSAPIHRLRMRLFDRDGFDIAVGHKRRYTVVQTRELVNGAGLKLIEIREVESFLKNWFYVTWIGRFMQRFNRWVIKDIILYLDRIALTYGHGSGHYVVARKGLE